MTCLPKGGEAPPYFPEADDSEISTSLKDRGTDSRYYRHGEFPAPMSSSFSRLFTRPGSRVLTVDCGASRVAVAMFVRGRNGKLRLESDWQQPVAPVEVPEMPWTERVGAALSSLAASGKVGGSCVVSLGGEHTLVRFVRTPLVEKARRAGIVDFELQQAIPCPPGEIVWDHVVLAETTEGLDLLLGAAKRATVESLDAAAGAAGFALHAIAPACVTLWHAFHYNYPEIRSRALLVSVGARSTNLVFIHEDRFFARTFGLGGAALTETIAQSLGLGFPDAERMKLRDLPGSAALASEPSPAAIDQATDRFAERLGFEIKRTMTSYLQREGAARPEILLLEGGGSLPRRLPSLLADQLGCRVERYDPLRGVEGLPTSFAPAVGARPFPAELVGLAVAERKARGLVVNLLPPSRKGVLRARQHRQFILAAVAFACAALLPVLAHFHLRARRAHDELVEIQQRLAPMRQLASRNSATLGQVEKAKAKLALLRGLADSRLAWIELLSGLQACVVEVEDVWLDRLQVPTAVASSASAPSPVRVLIGGRLLDATNPVSKVSNASYERVKDLLQRFSRLRVVAAVVDERFDPAEPGILRFDCTLVLHPLHRR